MSALRPVAESARENLLDMIERLHRAGYAIIPLGGPDGKKPLVSGWPGRRRLPLPTVMKRLEAAGSLSYGIRLDDLLVIDADTDNPQTTDFIEWRFGLSTVLVRTSRGLHHFFRLSPETQAAIPRAIRTADIALDFKSGSNAYVVGPGSIRPDGALYRPLTGDLATTALTPFVDRGVGSRTPTGPVRQGFRNRALVAEARQQAFLVGTLDALFVELLDFRDRQLENPDTVPDNEVRKIATWAWNKRLTGELWKGRNSTVQINRQALDLLLPCGDGGASLALYALLVSEHGHIPGKSFAVVPDALIEAGRLSLSRNKLYGARRTLVRMHLLELVQRGGVKRPDTFRLRAPSVAKALSPLKGGGRVSTFTLVPDVAQARTG